MLTQIARKFRYLFSNIKIRRQLFAVYLIAGFLPIFVVGLYLILNTRTLVTDQHYSQVFADNQRSYSVVLDTTTSLKNISDDIFKDTNLHSILKKEYETAEQSYAACREYTKFIDYADKYTEISQLTLYVNNETMSDYGYFKGTTSDIKETEWYKRAEESYGYFWLTMKTQDTGGTELHELALVRKIPVFGNSEQFAVLVITVDNNYLKTRVDRGSMITELAAEQGPLFYSTIPENKMGTPGMQIDYEEKFFKFYGITSYNGSDTLVGVSTLLPVGSESSLYIITIDNKALPAANTVMLSGISIMGFSLLATFIMVVVFSQTFSSRIYTLRQEMHKVAQGDYNIIEEFKGNDELVDLFTDLQVMIESTKKMSEEIFNERVIHQKLINHQQEMQFMMLTSQINPHFLYNTLETIRMKAYSAGNTEVATAIKLLGKSMRHVLETNGKPGPLSSELEYIRIYLEIQKLRFLDKFDYDITVAEEVNDEEYMILPLLLQPIVENAIVHGLEDKESDGFIQISIFEEDTKLIISVSDNGAGMAKDALDSLLERMRTGKREGVGHGIGLLNIHQRIVLYYGDEYGIDVKSGQGMGTQVLMYLPIDYFIKDEGLAEQ